MCGIVGVASVRPQEGQKWLKNSVNLLAHRGPDQCNDWWSNDGKVGFGHARLAILDTSEAGLQPMHSKNKNHTIIFNGEIYNHDEIRSD